MTTKSDFLERDEVKGFIDWLAERFDEERLASDSGKGEINFPNLIDAYENYHRPFRYQDFYREEWVTGYSLDDNLEARWKLGKYLMSISRASALGSKRFDDRVLDGDQRNWTDNDVYTACTMIFQWAYGDGADYDIGDDYTGMNNDFRMLGSLLHYSLGQYICYATSTLLWTLNHLIEGNKLLVRDPHNINHLFYDQTEHPPTNLAPDQEVLMSPAFNAVYSFFGGSGPGNKFVLYDSRFAAGLCYLIKCFSLANPKYKTTDEDNRLLDFKYINRNPSDDQFRFKQVKTYTDYTNCVIQASWIIEEAEKKINIRGQYLHEERAIEAALFMIGRDIPFWDS